MPIAEAVAELEQWYECSDSMPSSYEEPTGGMRPSRYPWFNSSSTFTLCLTRTWLHYHRIDCAHLNRHMQTGLFIHATAYGGEGRKRFWVFASHLILLDFQTLEISEIKRVPHMNTRHCAAPVLPGGHGTTPQGQPWTGGVGAITVRRNILQPIPFCLANQRMSAFRCAVDAPTTPVMVVLWVFHDAR